MGAVGSPGTSVRAFRDFLPRSQILGADVDEATLFRESRIETATVDQFDRASFARMTEALGCSRFDVIIDHGLHAVDANLHTLRFALEALQPDGWFMSRASRNGRCRCGSSSAHSSAARRGTAT
jgi:hypothetical protein